MEIRIAFVDYMTFKMECAREQETLQWKLDVDKAEGHLKEWEELKAEKTELLADAMPRKIITAVRNRPKGYAQEGWISISLTERSG